MKITLRKASAIQNSINDTIKGIELDTAVSINEFEEPEAKIAQASTKFFANANRKDKLFTALYEIRKAVGTANATAGIDSRLTDVAQLEKSIQFYTSFTSKPVRESANVLAGKLDKIRNRKEDSRASLYGRDDEVSTSVFTQEDVDGFRKVVAKAKKTKQKLQDEILELNVRTEISLSEATVAVLTEEGLV